MVLHDYGIEALVLKALDGHGWATTGTLASTWRLRNNRQEIKAALRRLVEKGKVIPCPLENPGGRATSGWIWLEDRELAAKPGPRPTAIRLRPSA